MAYRTINFVLWDSMGKISSLPSAVSFAFIIPVSCIHVTSRVTLSFWAVMFTNIILRSNLHMWLRMQMHIDHMKCSRLKSYTVVPFKLVEACQKNWSYFRQLNDCFQNLDKSYETHSVLFNFWSCYCSWNVHIPATCALRWTIEVAYERIYMLFKEGWRRTTNTARVVVICVSITNFPKIVSSCEHEDSLKCIPRSVARNDCFDCVVSSAFILRCCRKQTQ